MKPHEKLVLFDHQIFMMQQFGGVSRYFVEIMKHIASELWDIGLMFSNNKYIKEIDKKIVHLDTPEGDIVRRFMHKLGKMYSIHKIKKQNYGVLHLTHYQSYANNLTKRPIVLTYHDKIHSTCCYDAQIVAEQKKSFVRADKIIVISEYTKNDLISLFNVDEKKIEVIYHGVNKDIYAPKERIIKEKYILFVGTRIKYKNFSRFLEAFAQIIKKGAPELKLVCTGTPLSNDELRMIKTLGINMESVSAGFYSPEDLYNLYQNAEMFAFPSEHEGFGMPLLEAMVNNCPVVCSNASCFPEIAGDAAEYFDPLSVDDIYAAMKKVLFDDGRRKQLIEKGKKRCGEFTWEKSAQKHIDIYKSLV